jgi:hypothetical protein
MSVTRYTCPCCGYRTLHEPPGSYDICKVCFWEDDGVQLLDPAFPGGANEPSLIECQKNFRRIGACEERLVALVRPPEAEEKLDQEWRPAQESDLRWARTPRELTKEEYKCLDTWYYWKRKAT